MEAPAQITLIVGHRGTGKSALLSRIQDYFPAAVALDLDHEIEKNEGRSIVSIFENEGEEAFRSLEQKHLDRLLASEWKSPIFIALGAGFSGTLPTDVAVIWLRRPTDRMGRIFLDRPRLDSNRSPLEEYLNRLSVRDSRFQSWADEELTLSEGLDAANSWERSFFQGILANVRGALTLNAAHFRSEARLTRFLERRRDWNTRYELRDDLLNEKQIKVALSLIPQKRLLFSLRRSPPNTRWISQLSQDTLWDWPVEFGDPPEGSEPSILSLHELRSPSIREAGDLLEEAARGRRKVLLKLAVKTHTFEELWEGHQWACEDLDRRCFLPRSNDGRWAWYRLLMKERFRLNFFREGDGSAVDQPYLFEWLRTPARPKRFAAVLGDPVFHSRTPVEQFEYFEKTETPVFSIRVTEADWEQGAMAVLERLGLRAAAVTSPLKLKANQLARVKTTEAKKLESVNTLSYDASEGWQGANTDLAGVQALLHPFADEPNIAVWGGGGTLSILREVLPQAKFYSVRTGQDRGEGAKSPSFSPRLLVWGVGRSRSGNEIWPDPSWKPATVVDLNYGEDSPGREYAIRVGATYVSGLLMFKKQAEGQRQFWDQTLRGKS